MIQIFGILFFIILICLIYLYYQGKISRNIPIIFMFFLIIIIPFTYLEKNNTSIEKFSGYDQIMNSSLDIFYTNQSKKKMEMNELKKIPLLYNPLEASIIKKDLKPIELYLYSQANTSLGLYVIYNNFWYLIFNSFGKKENIFTYLIEDDFKNKSSILSISSRIKIFNDLNDLNTLINNAPVISYIIIIANNIEPIKKSTPAAVKDTFITKYNFSNWINTNTSDNGSLIVILAKSYDKSYTKLNEKSISTNDLLSLYQTIKIEPKQVQTNGGDVFNNVKTNDNIISISNEPLINSKINIISPALLNPNYSLSITVENNESFVYLSSHKLENQVVLYSKSPKSDIGPVSTTSLDTQKPQFWSFEPVTKIITDPLVVFIRTYTKPYFYLDAELENGVMVLKAKRFKAGLRQQWELIKNPIDITKYNIRHLKSEMYLAYSDFDGYLYKDDGSVFLTESDKYTWNIKKMNEANINKNVIEGFQPNKINSFIGMEVPTDFSTVENPSWKISGNVKGNNIVIESKGRTLWKSNYASIWNGKWIYHGTVQSYKATLNINTVKFLIIKMDANGKGEIIDEYFNFKLKVTNAGSNILTGIIPSGNYKDYRAILKLLPTDLQYSDPSNPFPIKMRYIIIKDSNKLNLSSADINNMDAYSTKFLGDKLILANFLEASGIQTDSNLAFSQNKLQKVNLNIIEQKSMPVSIKNANNFMINKIKTWKLLYKATTNGWNARTFHNLCDNKGATITIATLQDGRYIGAYSPISWGKVNGQYINNNKAFLFDNDNKYTTSESGQGPNYAIFQDSNYGPIFGSGHDFQTLSSWSPQQLSSYVQTYLNNNRGPLGVNRQTNNVYQLKDLEVYSITLQNNAENEWQIFPRYGAPMRVDKDSGDIQCLSYDGYNCTWDYVSKYGDKLNYIDTNRVNPLTCGNDHKNKYGSDGYSNSNNWCNNISKRFYPKIMYGEWISVPQKTEIRNLNNGEVVHIIFDDKYTKMVSSDGKEKYYEGRIDQFNPNNWNNYSNTWGGKYLLK